MLCCAVVRGVASGETATAFGKTSCRQTITLFVMPCGSCLRVLDLCQCQMMCPALKMCHLIGEVLALPDQKNKNGVRLWPCISPTLTIPFTLFHSHRDTCSFQSLTNMHVCAHTHSYFPGICLINFITFKCPLIWQRVKCSTIFTQTPFPLLIYRL